MRQDELRISICEWVLESARKEVTLVPTDRKKKGQEGKKIKEEGGDK